MGPTHLDTLCRLLQERLRFRPDERDLVLLHHALGVTRSDGRKEELTSTLCTFGQPHPGTSAMATTVGLPVAMATDLILRGTWRRPGVHVPLHPEFYRPMLSMLAAEGVVLHEAARPLN